MVFSFRVALYASINRCVSSAESKRYSRSAFRTSSLRVWSVLVESVSIALVSVGGRDIERTVDFRAIILYYFVLHIGYIPYLLFVKFQYRYRLHSVPKKDYSVRVVFLSAMCCVTVMSTANLFLRQQILFLQIP